MKRFYCLTCRKIRYVRTLPKSVINVTDKDPMNRHGVCRWHTDQESGMIHQESMKRKRVHRPYTGKKRLSATAAKSKSKKG
jgi:hypothetical protein